MLLFERLVVKEAEMLEPFSEEVSVALLSSSSDNAPGLNYFPMAF